MGSSSSSNLLQSLEYYSNSKDPNLGAVQVYTCRSFPQSFIMKIKHKQYDESLIDLYQSIEEQRSKNLITMFGCKQDDFCECNSLRGESMVSYWEYYNLYLDQLIERRAAKNERFCDEQVWYIIGVCLEGYLTLRSKNVYYDFSSQKIVIVPPQGKIKMYWSHLRPRNMHLAYFQHQKCHSEKTMSYFSPQQLKEIRSNHYNKSLNLQKCNMFSLGMMLVGVMSLTNSFQYYNSQNYSLNYQLMKSNLYQKIKPYYSSTLLSLVQACLQVQAFQRPSAKELINMYGKYFEIDSHLNMLPSSKSITEKTCNDSNPKRISLKKSKWDHNK